jgi:hypothetical protein
MESKVLVIVPCCCHKLLQDARCRFVSRTKRNSARRRKSLGVVETDRSQSVAVFGICRKSVGEGGGLATHKTSADLTP